MNRTVVIGVGNPYRRDDGAGLAVIAELRRRELANVDVVEESGEPVALISRWTGRDLVILVDAVTSGSRPGTIARIECRDGIWDVGDRPSSASTHGLGVADAVELGRELNRLPSRLLILGIETGDVSNGVGLSLDVGAAVDAVAALIAAEAAGVATSEATAEAGGAR